MPVRLRNLCLCKSLKVSHLIGEEDFLSNWKKFYHIKHHASMLHRPFHLTENHAGRWSFFPRCWRENFRLSIEWLSTTNVWFWKKCVAHLEFLDVCKVVVLSSACVSCSPTNTSGQNLYKKLIIRRFPSVHNGQSRFPCIYNWSGFISTRRHL